MSKLCEFENSEQTISDLERIFKFTTTYKKSTQVEIVEPLVGSMWKLKLETGEIFYHTLERDMIQSHHGYKFYKNRKRRV